MRSGDYREEEEGMKERGRERGGKRGRRRRKTCRWGKGRKEMKRNKRGLRP